MSDLDQEFISTGNRDQRRQDAERAETDAAIDIGAVFDRRGAEWQRAEEDGEVEKLLSEPDQTPSAKRELALDVRKLLEARGDIKDVGSVDIGFIERIGIDVCATPDLLEILVDKAKVNNKDGDGQIRLDDICNASLVLEQELTERGQTHQAGLVFIDHGISEVEIAQFIEDYPAKARSYARLLESPIVGSYSENVKRSVMEEGRTYPLEFVIATAIKMARSYNQFQERLEEGDPIALEQWNELMRLPQMQRALGEILLRQEFEIDKLPADFPDPEAV